MNAPEKITAAEPMNAAHEILMKAASGMCSQEIAAAITGTPRPTKPQIKAAEKMLKAIHDCGMLASQPGRGGVALYSLTTPVCNINEMGDVSLANEGKTAGVCDLAQTGSGSQAEDSPISDEVRAQIQRLNTVTPDEFSLLNVIADIRAAIGDPEGKIMLGDLAAHIQRDIGELIESLEVEKRVSGSAISAVAHICEHLGCDYHNGHVPVLRAIDALRAQITSLTTDVTNTRRALSDAQRTQIRGMNTAVAWPGQDVGAAVRIAELEATVSSQSAELDKAYRRDVMMGQIIGNHILAMSAAVIAREIDGPEKAWLWIENTLIGPGLYPDIEEAKALGGAQAWFNVQNDEERKRLKGISEEPGLNDHIKNAILAYLDAGR